MDVLLRIISVASIAFSCAQVEKMRPYEFQSAESIHPHGPLPSVSQDNTEDETPGRCSQVDLA